MNIEFEPAAFEEVREAAAWYLDKAGSHYADAFVRAIDAKLALLKEHPRIGTPSAGGMRQIPLKIFPYTLHYRIEAESLRVFAVAHQRRLPGYWRRR